jgi:predicted nucleic acid-binding protein
MAVKVVDTSAIAAVLFGEPDGPDLAIRIDGHELVAPTLFSYELANVCLKKVRREPGKQDTYAAAFAARARLQVRQAAVDMDRVLILALDSGLSAYDASYLWLARHMDVELVTLDRKLASAAAQ